jgi:hypothetical protein
MKKSSSDTTARQLSKETIIHMIMPVRLRKWCHRVREIANANPRKTVAIILAGVALNVGMVIYLSEKSRQQPFSYTNLSPAKVVGRDWEKVNLQAADIPFTWKNYQQITALKDSLEYLMGKANRNKEDTLLFIRIFERYAELDPAFAKALMRESPVKH